MNAIMAAKMRRNLEFDTPYTVTNALEQRRGRDQTFRPDHGPGQHGPQTGAQGLLFLAAEIAYIAFMVTNGVHNLQMLITLGSVERQEVWNEELQVFEYTAGDQSILLLLYGLATIILTGVMFWVWRGTLKSAYKAECFDKAGKHVNTFQEDLRACWTKTSTRLLMTPADAVHHGADHPAAGVHDLHGVHELLQDRQPSGSVRLGRAGKLRRPVRFQLDFGLHVLERAGLDAGVGVLCHLYKLHCGHDPVHRHQPQRYQSQGFWRFCFVLPCAVPMFVSAADHAHHAAAEGAVNVLLRQLGFLAEGASLPFFTDPTWARITVIVINIWVGVPYTLLQLTACCRTSRPNCMRPPRWTARTPCRRFLRITLPYMLYVTTPYLIATFTGNVNNFNVIYLLSAATRSQTWPPPPAAPTCWSPGCTS